jgi:hypothetical protein
MKRIAYSLFGGLLLVSMFFIAFPVDQVYASANEVNYGSYAVEADCGHLGEQGQSWVGIYAQHPAHRYSPWYGSPENGYEVCYEFYGSGWVTLSLWGNYQNLSALNPTVPGFIIDESGETHRFSAIQTSLLSNGCAVRAVAISFKLPYHHSDGGRAG